MPSINVAKIDYSFSSEGFEVGLVVRFDKKTA